MHTIGQHQVDYFCSQETLLSNRCSVFPVLDISLHQLPLYSLLAASLCCDSVLSAVMQMKPVSPTVVFAPGGLMVLPA